MPLVYTTFTIPTVTTFPESPDGAEIYIATDPAQDHFLHLYFNAPSGPWAPKPGSEAVIDVSPASLALIPTLAISPSTDIELALISPYNPWLIVINLIKAGTATAYQLFGQTLPAQPPAPVPKPPFPYTRLHRYEWPRTRQGPRSS